MGNIQKLVLKFKENPEKVRYMELEKILLYFGFSKRQAKGSHVKFKKEWINIVVAVHNNDCKPSHKKSVLKTLQFLKLL